MMRIVEIRLTPVAHIFAIVYAVCGLIAFVTYAATRAESLTLPLGIVTPVFHLNMNFFFPRSEDLIASAMLCGGTLVLYALTGWITGIAAALCFNFLAKQMGGIDASFVWVADHEPPAKPQP